MALEILLKALNERVPFPVMRNILRLSDLPLGRGGEETIRKLLKINADERDDYVENFNKLTVLYTDHLLVSEKAIRLFTVESTITSSLIKLICSYSVKQSEFQLSYPLPISEDKLNEVNSNLHLVKILESEANITLIFYSKRLIREEVEINTLDLGSEAKEELRNYREIYGIKEYFRQLFDIVIIWKNTSLIEVRVDASNGISSQEKSNSFILVIKEFNKLVEQLLGIKVFLNEPINLFSLIDKLYEADEGRVVDLAFTTDEGSIKSEKMRRGMVDLRLETYHKAGREAVDHISPYRLGIVWEFEVSDEIKTEPELLLLGNLRNISSSQSILEDVTVKKCCFLDDYNFIFQKINAYLQSNE